jgi:hypothetical protein
MRGLYIIFFLILRSICNAGGADTTLTVPDDNFFKAAHEIYGLKHGALIVRLKTNDKSVDAYRKAGQNALADKIVADRVQLNQNIADAFKYYFSFCKVYFIYAKNSDALLRREPGIFLNEKLQPDTSIKLKEKYFLIAEYGSYTSNERVDEYHYSGVYTTEPSNSTASSSALVILDTTFTQLQEPFPFAATVYLGGYVKAVEQLNKQLEKVYYDKFDGGPAFIKTENDFIRNIILRKKIKGLKKNAAPGK